MLKIKQCPLKRGKINKSWRILEDSRSNSDFLIGEDYETCKNLYDFISSEMKKTSSSVATQFCAHDNFHRTEFTKTTSMIRELQQHQADIRNGTFLGQYGFLARRKIRTLVANAAEKRLDVTNRK